MCKYFFLVVCAVALAACSKPAAVRVEPLSDQAWECSEWISAVNAPVIEGRVSEKHDNRAADGSSWFVAQVKTDKPVESARWMATGLGVFRLFVGGVPVGEEILRPGFTHPKKTKRSFTYDITPLLKGKESTLSAQLTPGWWADKIVTRKGHIGMVGRKCAFRSVLELRYKDGSAELIGTDTVSWKAGIAGPVKHAAIFDGEEYDARELPGYETPEKLSTPEINSEFSGEILPSRGAEVYFREDLAMAPKAAYVWKDVADSSETDYGKVVMIRNYPSGRGITLKPGETLVVDFGQNAAAVPDFVFKAEEGTVLTCLPGELLNDGNGSRERGMDGPGGSVHRLNLRTPKDNFLLKYTFAGKSAYERYRPQCTFFGYRYISVTATSKVHIRKLLSVPVTSITGDMEKGTLKTGDESINKLISNTLWGQRSNYLSVPTDCPQRNERLGWTADTQVFTATGSFFADTRDFFHKWMRDMRDSQSENGAFPGVAPTAQYGSSVMRFGWADAGIIVPWTIWKQFGDTAIIDENWDSMLRYMNHVAETGYRHSELAAETGNYQYADWLSYEPLESSGRSAFVRDASNKWVPLPDAVVYWDFLGACYMASDAGMMADMARATGRDAEPFVKMQGETLARLKESFFDGNGRFSNATLATMQTPALFALKNRLVEGEALEAMKDSLRANFAAHDGCLQTGFLGTSVLLQTLTDNGMSDLAWDLVFQRRNPSWLYSVDNGATTIWERWNSYTFEKGLGNKGMNSFNHYAYGCVCQWLWETAAGIASDCSNPGFRHIVMAPVPDRRLGSIDACYDSAAGEIRSSWRYEGDSWIWEFSIPEGTSASVTLPGESETSEYSAGNYRIVR